jgi:hypothetical protein
MIEEVLAVFTPRLVEEFLAVGGTQSWALDRRHAKRCRYAIMCRNAYTEGDGKERHGTAFMIGRIADIVPSTDTERRWLVTFDQYARIDVPDAWKKWRNPVRYTTLKELGVRLEDVKFKPMPPIDDEGKATHGETPKRENGSSLPLTITEAKRGLAKTYGVVPASIEITIRG